MAVAGRFESAVRDGVCVVVFDVVLFLFGIVFVVVFFVCCGNFVVLFYLV